MDYRVKETGLLQVVVDWLKSEGIRVGGRLIELEDLRHWVEHNPHLIRIYRLNTGIWSSRPPEPEESQSSPIEKNSSSSPLSSKKPSAQRLKMAGSKRQALRQLKEMDWSIYKFKRRFGISNSVKNGDLIVDLGAGDEFIAVFLKRFEEVGMISTKLGMTFGYERRSADQFVRQIAGYFKIDLEKERRRISVKPGYLLKIAKMSQAQMLELAEQYKWNIPRLRKQFKNIISSKGIDYVGFIKALGLQEAFRGQLRERYIRRRGCFGLVGLDFGFRMTGNNAVIKELIREFNNSLLAIDFKGEIGNGCFLDEEKGINKQ